VWWAEEEIIEAPKSWGPELWADPGFKKNYFISRKFQIYQPWIVSYLFKLGIFFTAITLIFCSFLWFIFGYVFYYCCAFFFLLYLSYVMFEPIKVAETQQTKFFYYSYEGYNNKIPYSTWVSWLFSYACNVSNICIHIYNTWLCER
jgi:hypothetical protein